MAFSHSKTSGYLAMTIMLIGILVNEVQADDFVPADSTENSSNELILDADNSGGDISLQFGKNLGQFLRWNSSELKFELSASLDVSGDLSANNLDLNNGELVNVRLENLTTTPACDPSLLGKIYFDSNQNQTLVCDGASFVPLGASEPLIANLAALQATRTTNFTLATTNVYYDLGFDQLDVATDSAIIEQDGTNADNFLIKADGLYQVTYKVNANDNSATHNLDTRVRKNDSAVLPGSQASNTNYSGEFAPTTVSFIAELNAGDFVTLQVQRTTSNEVRPGASLTLVKLDGIKGEKGEPGAQGAPGAPGVSRVIAQVYEQAGGLDVNQNTATPVGFDAVTRLDSAYAHNPAANNSRIFVNFAGWYRVSYNISSSNTDNGRRNIYCFARRNGVEKVIPSGSYSYSRNTTDRYATNTATFLVEMFNPGEHLEILCERQGSTDPAFLVAGESWLVIEKID
jgi:hypothetical protein